MLAGTCEVVQVALLRPKIFDQVVGCLRRESVTLYRGSYLFEVTIGLFPESVDPCSHDSFVLDTFIRIPPINLQKLRQVEADLGLHLRPIGILVLMLARRTLYLQMLHNILLDLFLSFRPDVGAKDADQHAGVDADGEEQYEGDEEDHGDGVGAAGDYGRFVGHVVVADIEKGGEGAPEGRELPRVAGEYAVAED